MLALYLDIFVNFNIFALYTKIITHNSLDRVVAENRQQCIKLLRLSAVVLSISSSARLPSHISLSMVNLGCGTAHGRRFHEPPVCCQTFNSFDFLYCTYFGCLLPVRKLLTPTFFRDCVFANTLSFMKLGQHTFQK